MQENNREIMICLRNEQSKISRTDVISEDIRRFELFHSRISRRSPSLALTRLARGYKGDFTLRRVNL